MPKQIDSNHVNKETKYHEKQTNGYRRKVQQCKYSNIDDVAILHCVPKHDHIFLFLITRSNVNRF